MAAVVVCVVAPVVPLHEPPVVPPHAAPSMPVVQTWSLFSFPACVALSAYFFASKLGVHKYTHP